MGSDTAPQILFESIIQAVPLLETSDLLIVFATQHVIDQVAPACFSFKKSIQFHAVTDVIAMGDDPLSSIRHKKNSSIVLGIKLLRKQKIDALVSAGNTGALVGAATISLSKFPGINRPALLALLPTQKGFVAVIDVGGNVSCKAENLIQFAQIGAAYQSCNLEGRTPKVGLLNIGAESKKGTLEVRQAYQALTEQVDSKMEFVGNIEGREVFEGKVDVLVTNGFTGNVLLKTTEGVASFIFDTLKDLDSSEEFKQVQRYFNYAEYPGALICGVEGVVIKCHGNATPKAMLNSIKGAMHLVRQDFISKIKKELL